MGWFRRVLFVGVLLGSVVAFAAVEPEGKVADYYRILEGNPRPGYLFERFCNSWLEQYDLRELETFLRESEDESATLLLAFYYDHINEPARAVEQYNALIEKEQGSIDLLFYRASAQMSLGRYIETSNDLRALLELDPDSDDELEALKLLGRSLLREGKRSEGLEVWEKLLEASEMDEDTGEELLDLQMAEGLYDEALDSCDRLLKNSRDAYRRVMLRMRRASILVRLDRRTDAVEGLVEAFGQTSQGSWLQRDVLRRMEYLYRGADDYSGLRDCFAQMLEQWPSNPELMQAYSSALLGCGKKDEALEAARAVIRLVPDQQEMKEWYVNFLMDMDRGDEVVEMLQGFIERYPDDNTLRMRLAEVHHQLKHEDETIAALLDYLEHSEKSEADYLDTGRTLARYDFNNEATSVLLEMLNLWPESMEGREAVALHLSRKSYLQLELAWKHYEWLAERCDLDTMLRLASALVAADRPDRAYDLMNTRRAEFISNFRFLTQLFDVVGALDKSDELLEIGLARVERAASFEEMEMATSALVYEIKKQNAVNSWIEKLAGTTDARSLWLTASLHLNNGNVAAADQLLNAAQEQAPEDAELMQCRLLLAQRQKDWDSAETILTTLIHQDPSRQALWLRELVPVLLNARKTEEALKWVEVWKKASPNAIRPYELERDVLLAANRNQEAIQAMREAVQRFDESKDLKLALGALYESNNRPLEAEQLYWRMLNDEETLDGRMGYLGDIIRVKQRRGQLNELIKELEQRAESSETAAFPLLGLSECYRIQNQIEKRNEVLDEVLQLRPNDVSVLHAKASLEEDLGNYDAVRSLMLRIADSDTTGAAQRKLLELEILYGDPEKAKEWLSDPKVLGNADAYVDWVENLIEQGCTEFIIDSLAQRAQEDHDDYRITYLYALALEELKDYEQALPLFVQLFQREEERSGLKNSTFTSAAINPSTAQLENWKQQYGGIIPDELLEILSKFQLSNTSQYILNAFPRRTNPRYQNSSSAGLRAPISLEQLHQYSLIHLRHIVSSQPEEEQKSMVEALNDLFPYAPLLRIKLTLNFGNPDWWTAVDALFPDDRDLQLFALLLNGRFIFSEETARSLIDEFSENHPDIVRRLLDSGIGTYPALWDLMIPLAEEYMNSPGDVYRLAQQILSASQQMPVDQLDSDLVALMERIEQRLNEMENVPDEYKLPVVAFRARYNQEYEPFVQYVKKSFENSVRSGLSLRNCVSRMSLGNYQIINFAQTPFPPNTMMGANRSVLNHLISNGISNRDKMLAVLREVDDAPFFKWMVFSILGASEEVPAEQKVVEAKEDKTVEELLALLIWYGKQGDFEKTSEYLLALKDAAENAADKDMLDTTLLQLCVSEKEIPEHLQEPLKEIIEKKLSDINNNRNLLVLLGDLMGRLEMPLEDLPQTQVQVITSTPISTGSRSSSTGGRATVPRPSEYEQIQTLLNSGSKTEEALLRMAVMIRTEALKEVRISSQNSSSNYELQNLFSYVQQRKLQEQLVALMKPKDDSISARAWFEYGYTCEMCGEYSRAAEGFQRAYDLRPDWSGVKLRLSSALILSEPEKARTLLADIPAEHLRSVITSINLRIGDSSTSYQSRLGMVEGILSILDSAEEISDSSFWNNMNNIEQQFRNNWYANSEQTLPDLYDPSEAGAFSPGWIFSSEDSSNSQYTNNPDLVKIQQRRRGLYVELLKRCAAAKDERNSDAFGRLTGYMDYSGLQMDREVLMELAKSCIAHVEGRYSSFDSSLRGRMQDPFVYFFDEIQRTGAWDQARAFADEIKGTSPTGQQLDSMISIQTAETDEEYIKLVKQYFGIGEMGGLAGLSGATGLSGVNQGSSYSYSSSIGYGYLSYYYSRSGVDTKFKVVLALHLKCGRDVDLDPIIHDAVENLIKEEEWEAGVELANDWVLTCQEQGMDVNAAEVYGHLFSLFFTDHEWALIEKADPGSISYQFEQDIYQKYRMIVNALRSAKLSGEGMRALFAEVGELESKIQSPEIIYSITTRVLAEKITGEWIRDAGLLEDWDDFEMAFFSGGMRSFFYQFVNQIGQNTTAIQEAMEAVSEPTFGSGLLGVLYNNGGSQDRLSSIVRYLDGYADQMAEDPEKCEQLFYWLQQYVRGYGMSLPEDDNSPMMVLYAEWMQTNAVRRCESLESMGLAEILQDPYTYIQKVGTVCVELVETDPERARALVDQGLHLYKMAYALQGNTTTMQSLLSQMFNSANYTPAESEFVLSVVADLGEEEAYNWYSESYCPQYLSRVQRRYRTAGMNSENAQMAAGKEMLTMLATVGDRMSLDRAQNVLNQINSRHYEALGQWLRQQELPPSNLRQLLHIYLDPDDECERWLKEFFENEETDASQKLYTFVWLMNRNGEKLSIMEDGAFLFSMLDLLDQNAPRMNLSMVAFQNMLNLAGAMESSDEKTTRIKRLFALWKNGRVQNYTNPDLLYRMAKVADQAGLTEEVGELLRNENLLRYPQTYAVALRFGLYDWVAHEFPKNFHSLLVSYPAKSELWITEDARAQADQIAAAVENEQQQLMLKILMARFPVKTADGKYEAAENLPQLFDEAGETLTDKDAMEWVIRHFAQEVLTADEKREKPSALIMCFGEQAGLKRLLEENNSNKLLIYVRYVEQMASERNMEELHRIVDAVWTAQNAEAAAETADRWLFRAMFKEALKSDDADVKTWIKTFFTEGEWPAAFQLELSGWFEKNAPRKSNLFDDPEMVYSLIEQSGGAISVSNGMLEALVKQAQSEKDAEAKAQRVSAVLDLVEQKGKNLNQYSWELAYDLFTLAVETGRKDAAARMMNSEQLRCDLYTFMVAIRYGMDSLVREQLPSRFEETLGYSHSNDAWILPEQAARIDEIVEPIEDTITRLKAASMLSSIPVKSGERAEIDRGKMYAVTRAIVEYTDDPKVMEWLIKGDKVDWGADYGEALCREFLKNNPDFMSFIRNQPRSPYLYYLQHIVSKEDYGFLMEWLRSISTASQGAVTVDQYRFDEEEFFRVFFRQALLLGRSDINELVVRAYNNIRFYGESDEPKSLTYIRRKLGVMVFDLSVMGLDVENPAERMMAFDQFEKELLQTVSAEYQQRFNEAYLRAGDDLYYAPDLRLEMMKEWINQAGENGFLPMGNALGYGGAYLENVKPEGLLELIETLRAMPGKSLMRDQFLAIAGWIYLSKTEAIEHPEIVEDVQQYINRSDLDPVERLRFFQTMNYWGRLGLDKVKLDVEKDLDAYSQLADQLIDKAAELDPENEQYSALCQRTVILLFELDRTEEAVALLEKSWDHLNLPAALPMFLSAIDYGAVEWCSQHLDLPVISQELRWNRYFLLNNRDNLEAALERCENADQKLAAKIYFYGLTLKGEERQKALSALIPVFENHPFEDPLLGAQSRCVLETAGMKRIEVDPYVMKYVEQNGWEDIVLDIEDYNAMGRMIFYRYINALLDSGKIEEVCLVYETLSDSDFQKHPSDWVVCFPFESAQIPEMKPYGDKRPEVSSRFNDFDTDLWYRLVLAGDKMTKKQSSYMGSYETETMAVCVCFLLNDPEKLVELYRNGIHNTTFQTFVAIFGICDDDHFDDSILNDIVERFYNGLEFCMENDRLRQRSRITWPQVGRWVLQSYPYCEEPEKWAPIIAELTPEKISVEELLSEEE
ncbi:MAG: tetratricopeptide repeat protein [Pontiellaceae bacterium]|nr:tetratricopeptide repeat protein [Pontiellaceae bacterium]